MSISDALAAAGAYLADHPDEARYRDSAAVARLGDDLRVVVTGPGDASLVTDMPAGVGGRGETQSPGWYLRAAQAACVAALVGMRAAAVGLRIDDVEVTIDSESDDRGILGLDETVPAGPLSTRVEVRVRAGGHDRQALEALARWAVDHCPVVDAVRRAVPVEIEVLTS